MVIQQLTKSGDPDVVGCVKCKKCGKGLFVAVELKATERDKPRPLQLHKLLSIRKAGGTAMIVHSGNVEESIKEIEEL